ncbi:MAG: SdrD B-like domain-containing protein [Actinomycetota bacterium]
MAVTVALAVTVAVTTTPGTATSSGGGRAPVAFADADLIDARIEGTVFVDFDRDGRVDPGETDPEVVGGQQITVSSPNRQERARSGDDGRFSLSLPNLIADDGIETGLRVEMATPDRFTATIGSASVRHTRVRDGDTVEIRFGIVPDSRCPDDPAALGDPSARFPDGHPHSAAGKLWSACFVDGSATSTVGAQDVLVAANLDLTEWEPPDGSEFGGHLDVEHLATKQQMGAIWGLAHDEWDGVLFASAVVKRHSELGPRGIDGLYWRSSDAADPTIMGVDLDELSPESAPSFGADPAECARTDDGTSYDYDSWSFEQTAVGGVWDCRDLGLGGGGSENFDWWAFDRVGRDGIGDIDTTPDGDTLLVLNATADAVFVYDIIDIGSGVDDGALPRYLRHHEVFVPGCLPGDAEAWGLTAIDARSAYVGVTCTAGASGAVRELTSHVVRLDITNGSSAVAVSLSHDHPHGPGYTEDAAADSGRFRPWLERDDLGRPVLPPLTEATQIVWRDFIDAYGYDNRFDWHQPLLSDIEIDPADDSIVLAVMDRWPMQTGVFNCDLDPSFGGCGYSFPAPPAGDYDGVPGDDPVGPYTSGIVAYVAGDLVRACNLASLGAPPDLSIEGARGCDPSGHSPTFAEPFGGGPAGPVEWYWNDQAFTGPQTDSPHPEAAQGAVAQLDQRGDVVYTAMNPTETFGAGLSRDAHADGAHVAGIQFFRTDFRESDGTGWKGASLGDVEGCSVPMSVGDHVWFDADVDGVRDPDESPIAGIEIDLLDGDTDVVIASTVTDLDGRWAFGTADGLQPFGAYVLRFTVGERVRTSGIDGPEPGTFELVPTLARAVEARADLDSDLPMLTEPGGELRLAFRTGAPGESDRTIDAGFAALSDLLLVDDTLPDTERPGPPWRILGILVASIAVVGAVGVAQLRRFVW